MQTDPVLMSLKDGYHRPNQLVFKAPVKEKKSVVVNGIDLLENVPPRTENEVREENKAVNKTGTLLCSSSVVNVPNKNIGTQLHGLLRSLNTTNNNAVNNGQ